MSQTNSMPFHVSYCVADIKEARHFYCQGLGFILRREYPTALHIDCFGNQVVVHEVSGYSASQLQRLVEGDEFPVPHWGVILAESDWRALRTRIESAQIAYAAPPHRRFCGMPYEQEVLFIRDPSANAIEFKYYTNARPENWC